METRVRLTFAARCRFPDIATAHGTTEGGITVATRNRGPDIGTATPTTTGGQWLRVDWPGDRTTWLRAEDLEPIQNEETDISE